MANVYASARVVFNISASGDLNMRVFEAMCSGRPLVTDDACGLDELFTDARHLYIYASEYRSAPGAIDVLLEYSERADKVGRAGRAEVLARHTYAHRAARMLEALGWRPRVTLREGIAKTYPWVAAQVEGAK